jgi:hypothetical protein
MAETGLKKFIQNQEEAVQLARETQPGPDDFKCEAMNIALAMASINSRDGQEGTTMAELIKNADEALKWLKGEHA